VSRTFSILTLVAAMLSASVAIGGEPPTEAELKERFKKRLAPIDGLKDAGKLGETTQGLVEVVHDEDAGESVTLPGNGKSTVGQLVSKENADRRELYEIIGERTGETVTVVAQQAAIRNFRQASPNHWLKMRNGKWIQKKDLPEPK
jgi:uncharacterized protein YdbL (DUF1318 family)